MPFREEDYRKNTAMFEKALPFAPSALSAIRSLPDGAGPEGLLTVGSIYLSMWTAQTGCRFVYCWAGRRGGFLNIDTFHWWLKPLPWRPLYRRWERFCIWRAERLIGQRAHGGFAGTLSVDVYKRQPLCIASSARMA